MRTIAFFVTVAPEISNIGSTRKVSIVGHDVKFFCKASGDPKPYIHWYRDNERIHGHTARFSLSSRSLLINPITLNDTGKYACLATNDYGHAWRNFTLSVNGRETA